MKDKKNWIIAALVIFLIIAVVGSSSDSQTNNKEELSAPTTYIEPTKVKKNSTYADPIKEEYMKGCDEAGGNKSYCECTYDNLKDTLGTDGLIRQSIEYSESGVFSNEMINATQACIEKY